VTFQLDTSCRVYPREFINGLNILLKLLIFSTLKGRSDMQSCLANLNLLTCLVCTFGVLCGNIESGSFWWISFHCWCTSNRLLWSMILLMAHGPRNCVKHEVGCRWVLNLCWSHFSALPNLDIVCSLHVNPHLQFRFHVQKFSEGKAAFLHCSSMPWFCFRGAKHEVMLCWRYFLQFSFRWNDLGRMQIIGT